MIGNTGMEKQLMFKKLIKHLHKRIKQEIIFFLEQSLQFLKEIM